MKSRLEQDERSYFHKSAGPDERRATQLLNATMSYARLILRRYGHSAPFAFVMDREGQTFRETLEIPRLPLDPERQWKLLTDHVAKRVRQGRLQGTALAANVTLREKSGEGYADAVIVSIELESGYAIDATVPYRILGGQMWNLLPRRIVLGKVVVEERAPRFFTERGASAELS